ncbi:hypothetical protein FF098_014335 [Parvularcula flava]|uniref:Uncharacterized protein n=1 Tax=Aquisalinus luteolus TaxID=1566827 RepID=A0A8J3A531_9PROT|nr:hypothetical protein [Aquisalinus luteolus]NHK29097.1 hypothetical protein [Aquisalinus luteolus]GGI00316.1 hypothetical protein GCM10011355_28320 [Aquisalinus luteolus]
MTMTTLIAAMAAASMATQATATQQQWTEQAEYLDRVVEWECGATPQGGDYEPVRAVMNIIRTGQTVEIYEVTKLTMLNGKNYVARIKYDADLKMNTDGQVYMETTSTETVSLDQLPDNFSWGDTNSTTMMLMMFPSKFGENRYELKGWSKSPGVIMDVACATSGLRQVAPE